MARIAVTGPDGFVGAALCRTLLGAGHVVAPLCRDLGRVEVMGGLGLDTETPHVVGDLGPDTDWSRALRGVEAIVHLAARVHVMREKAADPLAAFRLVNTRGTERLAREAARLGVCRLIYVSSIKVNGESTDGRGPFTAADAPSPSDPYGVSKWEAEQVLRRVSGETELETVVVRPPLVHGPGVGGNLLRLLRLVDRAWPLPLAGVRNARSMIGVDNLASLLACCVVHPDAAGRVFLAADGQDLSTPELIRHLAAGLGKPARLFPFPVGAARTALGALGRSAALDRIAGSLRVDAAPTRAVLSWQPPLPVRDALLRMCDWYRELRPRR